MTLTTTFLSPTLTAVSGSGDDSLPGGSDASAFGAGGTVLEPDSLVLDSAWGSRFEVSRLLPNKITSRLIKQQTLREISGR